MDHSLRFAFIALAAFTLLTTTVRAQTEIDLSTVDGQRSSSQENALRKAKRGDIFVFGQYKFIFQELVHQDTSLVYHAIDSKGRKVALRLNNFFFAQMLPNYVKETVAGYSELRNSGLRVVKMYETDNIDFASMEWIDFEFRLSEGMPTPVLKSLKNRGELQTYRRKLIDFLTSAAEFSVIKDFGLRQVVWTGDEFVLLDWLGVVRKWDIKTQALRDLSVLDKSFWHIAVDMDDLTDRFEATRKKILAGNYFICRRLFTEAP